jgi:hypothetical protein
MVLRRTAKRNAEGSAATFSALRASRSSIVQDRARIEPQIRRFSWRRCASRRRLIPISRVLAVRRDLPPPSRKRLPGRTRRLASYDGIQHAARRVAAVALPPLVREIGACDRFRGRSGRDELAAISARGMRPPDLSPCRSSSKKCGRPWGRASRNQLFQRLA